MAMQWLKRMFGLAGAEVSDPSLSSSSVGFATEVEGGEISLDSMEKPTQAGIKHLHTPRALAAEFVSVLDRAFCERLYGPELIFVSPSKEQKAQAQRLVKQISGMELSSEQLPRRPSSIPMLTKLLKIEDLNFQQISDAMLSDPALTSQVLKTANSPFFKLNNIDVLSLDQAAFRLGVGGIKKVVSAAVMMPAFKIANQDPEVSSVVWEWALATAKAFDLIVHARGPLEGSVYLPGLLPALSLLIVFQQIDKLEKDTPEHLRLLPVQRFQVFKQVAWKLCCSIRNEWGLPSFYDRYLLVLKPTEIGDTTWVGFDPTFNAENDGQSKSRRDAKATGTEKINKLLGDALHCAQYALVEASIGSPINIDQLSEITGTSEKENRLMLVELAGRP